MERPSNELIAKIRIKQKIAIDHRDRIWDLIQTSMKYTSPNEASDYSSTDIDIEDNTKGIYDSTAIIESNKLAKKLINLMFPPSIQFVGLQGSVGYSKADNNTIKKYGEVVFKALVLSNLEKELLNYIQNWSTLGTGALRLMFTGDLRYPIMFKQLPLKNLYFSEDAYSRASYVWYRNNQMEQDQIKQTWGQEYPALSISDAIDIYETVFYEKLDDGTEIYHYMASDLDYNNFVSYQKLNYNPFIVTRYKRFTNGINWGCGEAMNCLSNIVNVNFNKKLIRIAGIQGVKPALLSYGEQDVMSRIKLKLGEATYMGENQRNTLTLAPIGNPNAEFSVIQEDQLNIKKTFYADFMAQVSDTSGVRTAYEWSLRNKEFLNVFSPNYKMFEQEGMKQIFMSVFSILTEIEYGGIKKETVKALDMQPYFRNRLTDNANFEKIQTFNNYVQNLVQLFTFPIALASIKVEDAIEVLSLWYEIEPKMLQDKDVYMPLIKQYVEKVIGANTESPQAVVPEQ